MKILYLTDQVFLHGGVEKVLSQKANFFATQPGYKVHIVTYNQAGAPPVYPFHDKIVFEDLAVNYDIAKSYFHPDNLKKIPLHRKALKRAIKRIAPDVIINTSIGPDFYFLPYLKGRIPIVKEFHSSRFFYKSGLQSIKAKLFQKLDAWTEQRYTALVVLNPDEKSYYHNKRIFVLPNPVETAVDAAPLNSKKVLAAGRISPVKDFSALIDCFVAASEQFPDWSLHIYGEDYVGTKAKLTAQIEAGGLGDRVQFMGVTNNMSNTMLDYSIYGMTSKTECFPMVLLESLAVGLPVLSFDVPTGPRHIVSDESDGFLIAPNDRAAFTERLKLLMGDEALRSKLGRQAIQNAKRFSTETVMRQWQTALTILTSK